MPPRPERLQAPQQPPVPAEVRHREPASVPASAEPRQRPVEQPASVHVPGIFDEVPPRGRRIDDDLDIPDFLR
jgi:hypothetical protein